LECEGAREVGIVGMGVYGLRQGPVLSAGKVK